MEVDWENRNCYNCRCFGHIARYCRNRGIEGKIGEGKRLKYQGNKNNRKRRRIEGENGQSNNLNRDRDLIVLD